MPRRPSDETTDWLLIAGATMLVLFVQRYVQASASMEPALNLARPAPVDANDVADAGQAARAAPNPARRMTPFAIFRDRWKDILWRTWQRISEDRLLATAAGVVFYGLLAIFPAITALVSSYGLFADPSMIGANLQTLALMLPKGSFEIVQDQIARVLAKGNGALGATFLFGLVLALWSANAGVKAVIDAINVAYEERETRGFIRLNLVSLAFTSGAIVALLLMVSAVVALPLALDHIGLAADGQAIVSLARWPLLLVILLVALGVLYRFGPSRDGARRPGLESSQLKPSRLSRSWFTVGAAAAALLWIGGSALLSWYLSNFGNYGATYGSLGAAIGLMMWMWMSAIIVLLGAELNSEIERQTGAGASSGVAPDGTTTVAR
jgi:membrane protein